MTTPATTPPALASAPAPTSDPPPAQEDAPHRFRVGALDCVVVNDGTLAFPAPVAHAFASATARPGEVARELDALGLPTDGEPLPENVLAVRTAAGVVLVDTGFGGAVPGTGRLRDGLRAAGIAPDDVALVLLTHLHPDHIGGVIGPDGAPAFPNARYVVGRAEWEFWASDPALAEVVMAGDLLDLLGAAPRALLPRIRDRVRLVDDGDEVAPGVRVHLAAGHTPGQLAVELTSGGERLLHLADAAVYAGVHLRRTDWFGFSDNWPAHTVASRRRLLARAADEGLRVLGYHFPFPGLGRVVREGDEAYRWEPDAR